MPLRVELGPRELTAAQVVVARRIRGSKETYPLDGLAGLIQEMLQDDQQELLAEATALRDAKTKPAQSVQAAHDIASEGFARIPWRALGPDGEDRLAQDGISVRCLIHDDGKPVDDPDDDKVEALLARAY